MTKQLMTWARSVSGMGKRSGKAEFASQQALQSYMRQHPKADASKHSVAQAPSKNASASALPASLANAKATPEMMARIKAEHETRGSNPDVAKATYAKEAIRADKMADRFKAAGNSKMESEMRSQAQNMAALHDGWSRLSAERAQQSTFQKPSEASREHAREKARVQPAAVPGNMPEGHRAHSDPVTERRTRSGDTPFESKAGLEYARDAASFADGLRKSSEKSFQPQDYFDNARQLQALVTRSGYFQKGELYADGIHDRAQKSMRALEALHSELSKRNANPSDVKTAKEKYVDALNDLTRMAVDAAGDTARRVEGRYSY